MKGLYCLMSEMNVSEDLANMLMHTAIAMIQNGRKTRMPFKLEHAEGVIETTYKYALLGTIGGYRFRATVETDAGTRTVNYIVRDSDYEGIENGRWVTLGELLGVQPSRSSSASMLN
jgi:capsid protein